MRELKAYDELIQSFLHYFLKAKSKFLLRIDNDIERYYYHIQIDEGMEYAFMKYHRSYKELFSYLIADSSISDKYSTALKMRASDLELQHIDKVNHIKTDFVKALFMKWDEDLELFHVKIKNLMFKLVKKLHNTNYAWECPEYENMLRRVDEWFLDFESQMGKIIEKYDKTN